MNEQLTDEKIEYLFRAILSLDNIEECFLFFRDLCTESEVLEMARRLTAARMLRENRIYTEIAQEIGLSTATISRVNRCLKYGGEGYTMVLDRVAKRK